MSILSKLFQKMYLLGIRTAVIVQPQATSVATRVVVAATTTASAATVAVISIVAAEPIAWVSRTATFPVPQAETWAEPWGDSVGQTP
jgi:hypothetical protein